MNFDNVKRCILLFVLCLCVENNAQNFTNGFNFTLPWNDSSSQKFLPNFPIVEINDFISVNSNGNFAIGNNPIRFWGTNLVADGAFPINAEANAAAGRMRKMGYNLVRLHHIDNPWSSRSLFANMPNTRSLNNANLDKLEYLISALKKNGIYINMNLNVSRPFSVKDGVEGADSIPDYAKGVTIFDPYLIQLQKEYASQLLTHVNPHTGLSLVNDPVMAMVEVINENSVYRMWRENNLKPIGEGGSLIWRHNVILNVLWNNFLLSKYNSTENLRAAWDEQSSGADINLIKNGDFESAVSLSNWEIELHSPAKATFVRDAGNPYSGAVACRISVNEVTGTDWHIQFKQTNIKLTKDSIYTITFAAKAEGNRTLSVTVINNQDPYTWYGGHNFEITDQWDVYSFSIKAIENINTARISFSFNNTLGNYWLDDIKFGAPVIKGLLAGESLDENNVMRIDYSDAMSYSDNRVKDMSVFYIKLQNDFYDEMKNYLKNTLGVKVPIVGTNWNIGPGDLITQKRMDYIDNHAYWDHPQFPNEPWSSTDWKINNTPMVLEKTGLTIEHLFAGSASIGKPYTVSELNDCFPNRYQTESMIFTTAYFSFHNADGVMFFDYNGSNTWNKDMVEGYFDLHRNPAMMALMPSCAFAYRNNFISPAQETVNIDYSENQVYLLPKNDFGNWTGIDLFPKRASLLKGFKNNSFNATIPTDLSFYEEPASPYISDTGEIIWNTDGIITIGTNNFVGAAGFLQNFSGIKSGNLELKSADGFGTFTWTSLSFDSLSAAQLSLFTISTMVQNTGMVWDGTTTIHNNWGSSPTQLKPIILTVRLNIFADSIRVCPLDNSGREIRNYEEYYLPVSPNHFEVTFDQSFMRSLWFGIERYGSGYPVSVDDETGNNLQFRIDQNYPNPFNYNTIFKYSVPENSNLKITVFNTLGEVISTLYNAFQKAGKYNINWDGKNNSGEYVSSGTYLVQFQTGNNSVTKKILLMK